MPRKQEQDQGQDQEPVTYEEHETARELTEKALDELEKGNEEKADELIEEATQIDESAYKEVVEEIDEDGGSAGRKNDA